MEKQNFNENLNKASKEVTNTTYIDLLEKYFLLDKTEDLDKKHKEWSKHISN